MVSFRVVAANDGVKHKGVDVSVWVGGKDVANIQEMLLQQPKLRNVEVEVVDGHIVVMVPSKDGRGEIEDVLKENFTVEKIEPVEVQAGAKADPIKAAMAKRRAAAEEKRLREEAVRAEVAQAVQAGLMAGPGQQRGEASGDKGPMVIFLNGTVEGADRELQDLYEGKDIDDMRELLSEAFGKDVKMLLKRVETGGWRLKLHPTEAMTTEKMENLLKENFRVRRLSAEESRMGATRHENFKRASVSASDLLSGMREFGVPSGTQIARRGMGVIIRSAERNEEEHGRASREEIDAMAKGKS